MNGFNCESAMLPVTILMSCYNSAHWLHESINSVLNQSFKNFEFIVVDDGSSDDTLMILRAYAERDTRIRIIAKSNTGLADSLNAGIRQASGEWIARIDADDIWESIRLEKQLVAATANPAQIFFGTGLVEIDAGGNALKTHHYPCHHALLLRNLRTARKFPPHSSALYRADKVRAIGGYRPRIRRAQDCDLWLRLSEVGELACLPEVLVRIRKHSNQVSHEEAGRRQILDARIAMTSYWIRQHHHPDPVDMDEAVFSAFSAWVLDRLVESRLFDFQLYKSRLKAGLVGIDAAPYRRMKVMGSAFSQPAFAFEFIRQRFFGETLTRQLSLEWIKQSKSCVVL